MEFDRQADGQLTPLPAPSIDTGMGLERVCAVLQNVESNYDTDLFAPLLDAIGKLAGKKYRRSMSPDDVSMRVVADHIRSMTFLISDGVIPSNETRGYVLRKIMRRAMRHGMRLGIAETFLHKLVDVIVREMGDAYPELRTNRDTVVSVVRNEEERFIAVLAGGLPKLEDALDRASRDERRQLSGDEAFKLYDTFGLPLDFIEDLAGERKVGIDRGAFDRAMEGQRDKARAKSAFESKKGQEFSFSSDEAQKSLSSAGDRFEGYTTTTVQGYAGHRAVRHGASAGFASCRRDRKATRLSAGRRSTPKSGGQVSDVGALHADATGRIGQRSRA